MNSNTNNKVNTSSINTTATNNTTINKEETTMTATTTITACTPKNVPIEINVTKCLDAGRQGCHYEASLIVIPGGHFGIDYIEGQGFRLLEALEDMGKAEPEYAIWDTYETLEVALDAYNDLALNDHVSPAGKRLEDDRTIDLGADLAALVSATITISNRTQLQKLYDEGHSEQEVLKYIQDAIKEFQATWAYEEGLSTISLSTEDKEILDEAIDWAKDELADPEYFDPEDPEDMAKYEEELILKNRLTEIRDRF